MEKMMANIEIYGYILLFFASFGGTLLGIVSAGVLSSLEKLDLVLSIVIASSGNMCGNLILVYLAKYQKRFFRSKKYTRKIALVSLWLKKYGIILIFANKYIYGFKSIVPLAVGMSGYSVRKFVFWNLWASLIWASLMGVGGFFASHFVIEFFGEWKQYSYIPPLLFGIALIALFWILRSKSASNRDFANPI